MATSVSARRVAYAKQLAEAVQKAVAVLSGLQGVERLSIFGSYARGRRDLLTDLDLLVVWETSRPPVERLAVLYPLLDLPVDLDLICYTPEEFREQKDLPFLRHILAEEVLLLEKKPA
jgi:predicted nucleotidyltransferase